MPLTYFPALERAELLAPAVAAALSGQPWADQVRVAAIDPGLADTAQFWRRQLGARKASFGAVDVVTSLTGMEYGGITPIGLPESWPVLVDELVAKSPGVVVGSGIRGSKLRLPGRLLAELPAAQVVPGLGLAI